MPKIHNRSRKNIETSLEGDQVDLAHGSFDNDLVVITETVRRITGKAKLPLVVENLGGF